MDCSLGEGYITDKGCCTAVLPLEPYDPKDIMVLTVSVANNEAL
jgi:hypothetical protein